MSTFSPLRALTLVAIIGLSWQGGCGEEDTSESDGTQSDDTASLTPEELAAASEGRSAASVGGGAVLYLNFDGGRIFKQPASNSATNHSSLVINTTTDVPAFPGTAVEKMQVMARVKQFFADFNVQVVTSRPKFGVYTMAMIGGGPDLAGRAPNIRGLATMDCNLSGSTLEQNLLANDVIFIFAQAAKDELLAVPFMERISRYIAHEAGHSFGLTHVDSECDIMSPNAAYYCPSSASVGFLAETLPVTVEKYEHCGITQASSRQSLLDIIGKGTGQVEDTEQPVITLLAPSKLIFSNLVLGVMYTFRAEVADDVAIKATSLYVDGQLKGTDFRSPSVSIATSFTAGAHKIKFQTTDTSGKSSAFENTVIVSSDYVAPQVTITSPSSTTHKLSVAETVQVRAHIDDNAGVSKVEFLVDDVPTGVLFDAAQQSGKRVSLELSRDVTFDWKSEKTGFRTLKVVAYDAAGNKGQASTFITFVN